MIFDKLDQKMLDDTLSNLESWKTLLLRQKIRICRLLADESVDAKYDELVGYLAKNDPMAFLVMFAKMDTATMNVMVKRMVLNRTWGRDVIELLKMRSIAFYIGESDIDEFQKQKA